MSWLGKILGGVAGFSFGGPIGALVGAALGHQFFDKNAVTAGENNAEAAVDHSKLAFFTASFWVMGHIAKADGRVTKNEVDLAKDLMHQWNLDSDDRKFARTLFRQGRDDSNIALDEVLDQLRRQCRGSSILRVFLEIQVETAVVDSELHPGEYNVLRHICQRLHLPETELQAMLNQRRRQESGPDESSDSSTANAYATDEAYTLLELDKNCSLDDIKRAYRRMMNRYHPDKLASKGLPEEMMRIATEKTRQIKAAYEHLRQVHGAK
ncbi:co-chaperone DjlA [Thioalkalivibrio sp. HK1]|uniref:co-chaperone DjlA n=1 Tax=Thioalkalivibrio sp. HK1 TaxID=1469245 RepID=UPI000470B622|nr:co-chaperone DjlA [Thioalkalivibrio sp. HK1]